MAKKKKETQKQITKIPVEDLEIDGVYRTYVKDIVKVLEINEQTETVKLYNISGAHRQWTKFKYVNIVEKVR